MCSSITLELLTRFELVTSSLPRTCSATWAIAAWRPRTGSNRRPPAWQAGVLTNWTTRPQSLLIVTTLIIISYISRKVNGFFKNFFIFLEIKEIACFSSKFTVFFPVLSHSFHDYLFIIILAKENPHHLSFCLLSGRVSLADSPHSEASSFRNPPSNPRKRNPAFPHVSSDLWTKWSNPQFDRYLILVYGFIIHFLLPGFISYDFSILFYKFSTEWFWNYSLSSTKRI